MLDNQIYNMFVRRRTSTFLSALQQVFLAQDATEATPSNPHWRETIFMYSMWQSICRSQQHDPAHAPSFRDKTLLMSTVLKSFHEETSP